MLRVLISKRSEFLGFSPFGANDPNFLSKRLQTSCHRPSGWMSRWAACCVGAEFELEIFRKRTAAEVKHAKHVGTTRAAAPREVAADYD